MLSILNKVNIVKEIAKSFDNNVFWTKSNNTTTTKQSNIRTLAGAGN